MLEDSVIDEIEFQLLNRAVNRKGAFEIARDLDRVGRHAVLDLCRTHVNLVANDLAGIDVRYAAVADQVLDEVALEEIVAGVEPRELNRAACGRNGRHELVTVRHVVQHHRRCPRRTVNGCAVYDAGEERGGIDIATRPEGVEFAAVGSDSRIGIRAEGG